MALKILPEGRGECLINEDPAAGQQLCQLSVLREPAASAVADRHIHIRDAQGMRDHADARYRQARLIFQADVKPVAVQSHLA